MSIFIQLVLGVLYSQVLEWGLHRFLLHGVGGRRGSVFSFHFFEHHRAVRMNDGFDDMYKRPFAFWTAAGKEWLGLLGLGVLHLPIWFVAPWFFAAMGLGGGRYYVLHRRSHLDPEWCRENLPWHYAHHMGPNQHKNWGVTTDWVDRLMGTREAYVGTPKQERDALRRKASVTQKVG